MSSDLLNNFKVYKFDICLVFSCNQVEVSRIRTRTNKIYVYPFSIKFEKRAN